MNKEVRRRYGNIPPIEVFITRRIWRYIRKIVRDDQTSIPKKLLGAWIHQLRKAGRPQNSNRNHFIMRLCTVIPEHSETLIGLAKDEEWWNYKINGFFNKSWEQDEETEEIEERIEEWEARAEEMEEGDNTKKMMPMLADEKTQNENKTTNAQA